MSSARGTAKPETAPEPAMTLDTAVDLAESLVTKFADPLLTLRDVVRVARDSKNVIAEYTKTVATLEGRLEALRIEEAAATARVANATGRAVEAERSADQRVQAAHGQAAEAEAAAERQITAATQELATRRDALEADLTGRLQGLEAQVAGAQQRLDATRREYDELMVAIRTKFVTSA